MQTAEHAERREESVGKELYSVFFSTFAIVIAY